MVQYTEMNDTTTPETSPSQGLEIITDLIMKISMRDYFQSNKGLTIETGRKLEPFGPKEVYLTL